MASGAMIYLPTFIEIVSGKKKEKFHRPQEEGQFSLPPTSSTIPTQELLLASMGYRSGN
jgi:hypothetical protein